MIIDSIPCDSAAAPAPATPSPEAAPLSVITATALDELSSLRDRWSAMRAGATTSGPADPDRYLAELRHAPIPTEPYVVLFQSGRACRALIVGRMSRRRLLYKIGHWSVRSAALRCLEIVYDGLICPPSAAACAAVVAHLKSLLDERRVDVIRFDHLPVNHELYATILRSCQPYATLEPHWRLDLGPGMDQIMASFSPKHRKNVRRTLRTFPQHFDGDVVLRVFDRAGQLDECIAGTAQLAVRTYQAGLGCQFADTPLWRAILTAEAQLGRLRCYWLVCQGRPIAFQMGMVYNGCYSLYFLGHLPEYNKLSPGIVLHIQILEQLCATGVREFDYGFGDSDYKRMYGSASHMEATLHIFGRSWRARYATALHRTTLGLSSAIKRGLRLLGAAGWFKKRWRARLSKESSRRRESAEGDAATGSE